MIFFAIQQISSGLLIPPGGKKIGGHTKQEPNSARPPRLFITELNARRALSCYIQGKWKEHYSTSYDGEYDYSGPEPDYKTKRNKEDFKVVKIEARIK